MNVDQNKINSVVGLVYDDLVEAFKSKVAKPYYFDRSEKAINRLVLESFNSRKPVLLGMNKPVAWLIIQTTIKPFLKIIKRYERRAKSINKAADSLRAQIRSLNQTPVV